MSTSTLSAPFHPIESNTTVSVELDVLREAAKASRLRRSPSEASKVAIANEEISYGWSGILTAVKIVSAWELRRVPKLSAIPDAFWGGYAEWIFAVPCDWDGLDRDALADHLIGCLDDLADWMMRNLAALPVREAANSYLRAEFPALSQFPQSRRAPYQLARARLLERSLGGAVPAKMIPSSRLKRKLRVGLIHESCEASPEIFASLARCAQLDTERVELHFLALRTTGGAVEDQWRQSSASMHVLPEEFALRLTTLREMQLDILIVGDDISGHPFPLAHIVQLRVAPLQVSVSPLTTGIGSMDLAILGCFDPAAKFPDSFHERLALVPATLQGWDTTADRPSESTPWDRQSVGLDARTVCVVTSVSDLAGTGLVERCARVASLSPAVRMVLIPEPGTKSLASLRQAADDLLSVRIHEPVPFDHAEFASLLGLADLAIELEGPAAALALEMGVPLLTIESSPTAALLITAGLEKLIFPDFSARDTALRHLIRDSAARSTLREEVIEAMKVLPRFADTYAMAADFTAVLERAWDELCEKGAKGFRRTRTPIQAESVHSILPADLQSEGRALFAAGRFERAAPCFLSAIQRSEGDASLWFDLARSYHAIGDQASAIASLEASLRLDEGNGPGWLMLGEMAADAGLTDLAQDAVAVADGLACDADRLAGLRARIAA